MASENFLSIIVPVYKVEKYIHRCIDSILAQTFSDFELILVDDGSPDNCPKICDEYAEKDNRITVIHKENGGLSSARNAGIDYMFHNSNSEYVTFIDSDDWIHPKYLEFLYRALTENKSLLSCCLFKTVTEQCDNVDEDFILESVTPEFLWTGYRTEATVAVCKLYSRELFENIRYPVGKIQEDEYTTYKALFACDKISFVQVPLYYYFYNENGIMNSEWNLKQMDAINAYYEQYLFFKENGYGDFAKTSLICCLRVQKRAVRSIKELCPNDKKLFKDTRKRFRRMLKEHAYEIDLKNSPDRKAFMKAAYPIESKVKKLLTVIFEKLYKKYSAKKGV